ncbi:hypothetical protein J3456_16355 [Sulfitobacter sp. NFXS29]|uniref:hotdog fold domain-containing protein n=1 Tax=Sulfitobacter sp. NFXS29 TaxID=2818438 RepID=UPI0032DFFFC8
MTLKTTTNTSAHVGMSLSHRRYIDFGKAHYDGNLVDGGFLLGQYSDIATDLSIQMDGHEGLFASYSEVTFHAPVRGGDVLEVKVDVEAIGRRSRSLSFSTWVVSRAIPERGAGCAEVLTDPILAVVAKGTVVVPLTFQISE